MIQFYLAVFMDAIALGFVFIRLTRPEKRANSIIMSDRAVVQKINGHWYFMMQVRAPIEVDALALQ
jgi:hypothetical protein